MEQKKCNIKEFAKLCRVTPRTLKYYEEMGVFFPESIGENGYRIYSMGQSDQVSTIKLFQEYGLSLKEIKSMMENTDLDSIIERLKEQKEILSEKMEELKRQEFYVDETLRKLQKANQYLDRIYIEQIGEVRFHIERVKPLKERKEAIIINYLSSGFQNGGMIDFQNLELLGLFQREEAEQKEEEGDLILYGKCLNLYCNSAPKENREQIEAFYKAAQKELGKVEFFFCEEILQANGKVPGIFRYFTSQVKYPGMET